MSLILSLLQAVWFILPAYVANSLPVSLGGGTPIDFNRKMKDRRYVLGKGKTWRGLFAGISGALLVSYMQISYQARVPETFYMMSVELGFILGFGALMGDMTGSFIKRRNGIKRGEKSSLLDKYDFIIGALLLAYLFSYKIALTELIIILAITPVAHRLCNIVAYKLRMKSVPW